MPRHKVRIKFSSLKVKDLKGRIGSYLTKLGEKNILVTWTILVSQDSTVSK